MPKAGIIITFHLTSEVRGSELSADDMISYNARLEEYKVQKL